MKASNAILQERSNGLGAASTRVGQAGPGASRTVNWRMQESKPSGDEGQRAGFDLQAQMQVESNEEPSGSSSPRSIGCSVLLVAIGQSGGYCDLDIEMTEYLSS